MPKKILVLLLVLGMSVLLFACGAANSNTEDDPADAPANPPTAGGWSTGDPTVPTDDQIAVFNKATESMDGVDYEPVLYLGSQIVAGRNHRFLCKAQVVYPDAPQTWAIVEVYEDLEHNAELTSVVDLTDEQAAQYGVTP